MAVVLGGEKRIQHHTWRYCRQLSGMEETVEREGDRQTLPRIICTQPSPNSFEAVSFYGARAFWQASKWYLLRMKQS